MKSDNIALDIILKFLVESKSKVPSEHLQYAVIRDRTYTKEDYARALRHLKEKNYIVSFVGFEPNKYFYSLSKEGKDFYLSGGFAPNSIQKINRWLKGDTGYANLKWILTSLIALVSLTISIIVYFNNKH